MSQNTSNTRMPSCAASLADSVGFDLLGDLLGCEVKSALEASLEAGVAFPSGSDPLEIYRNALQASIRDIEGDERGKLFQRFLRDGPYEGDAEIPHEPRGRPLTRVETAAATTFLYSFMVNSFKGAITELLAAVAYEMIFWYMEKVGEIIYTRKGDEPDPKPREWKEMTPAEAGRNAVKMMLYYAMRPYAIKENEGALSKADARIKQKAVAVYNTYGFGYALGMNFRNKIGRREMLWPEDLDEIAADGHTKNGCRIV